MDKNQIKRLRRAYSDYLYMRKMMGAEGDADLPDLASMPLRFMKQHGRLDKLEETGQESYAVKINVNVSGENEPWLLMLGNSTSPEGAFGNALLQKNIPYAVMRVSGSADPLNKAAGLDGALSTGETALKKAEIFSDYSARAGIPVGMAAEMYHPSFTDKGMEAAFVLSATPAVNMRREDRAEDDLLLVTEIADAEGDADENHSAAFFRKIHRLLSTGNAGRMIKEVSSSDDGSYVFRLGSEYGEAFMQAAEAEGLRCRAYGEKSDEDEARNYELNEFSFGTVAATGQDTGAALTKENNTEAVRNEAESSSDRSERYIEASDREHSFSDGMRRCASDINTCSTRGLSEKFDSSIGSSAVFMPLGGINRLSPVQAMVNKLPVPEGSTDDCSVAAWGGNPYIAEKSPYRAGYLAVVESVSKLIAAGASFNEIYLSLYGRFSSENNAEAALLGAFEAEMGLGIPAISGNHEIAEGNFPDMLLSFAATMGSSPELISPEFKGTGHRVVMLAPIIEKDRDSVYYGLPTPSSLVDLWRKAYELIANGRAVAAYAPGIGGVAEAVMKMSYGNGIGFEFASLDMEWEDAPGSGALSSGEIFGYSYGSIILEMLTADTIKSRSVNIREIGHTTEAQTIARGGESINIGELMTLYEGRLESVYPAHTGSGITEAVNLAYSARSWHTPIFKRTRPKFLIPVVPGCTGDADVIRAVKEAGGKAEMLLLKASDNEERESSARALAEAIGNAQVIILPDGYSSGAADPAEITEYLFRQEAVSDALSEFLDRKDGLMAGIGEGFKALVNLGLVPFGKICSEGGASLEEGVLKSFHSGIVRIRVASNKSPWLRTNRAGDVFSMPLSGDGGRFTASEELMNRLVVNGQIATQYADAEGNASADVRYNPPGSEMAAEAVTSPDGRIIGRMGRSERVRPGLYRNVPENYLSVMFENAVRYFK